VTTPSGAATSATSGTVAGRPQPQTTAEPAGGPFVRHAPDGRRAMYQDTQGPGGFMARPMVSSPGWNKGYRVYVNAPASTITTGALPTTGQGALDTPNNWAQLVQMKDAFGTQLLTGPGWDMTFLVQLLSGQFGIDLTRSPMNLPSWSGVTAATNLFSAGTYLPFEFAKGYGVISGANAALLPVLQINMQPFAGMNTGTLTSQGAWTETVDSDFYWLPNVPTDPPGIGTTCQWIYQPSNPPVPSGFSGSIQFPRLGGYLTVLGIDARDSTGARVDLWGSVTNSSNTNPRPKLVVDGVPLVDSALSTIYEDMAIQMGIGAAAANTQTGTGTIPIPRPAGVMAFSRKTALAQRDFGLLETGEIFLSTNPGTQIEMSLYPWGTFSNTPGNLNAVIGQVVPSGALVQGLPEV
jgi:hypothetical protein